MRNYSVWLICGHKCDLLTVVHVEFCMQFPHKDSFLSVQCVQKKLPVNLAVHNPTGEVLPTNMYSTSNPGCLISVMFKSCPSNKQASGRGRLGGIITFFPSWVKSMGVGLDGLQEWLYIWTRNAQSLPHFPENIQERTFQISVSLIHLSWLVPTQPVDWALLRWISNESSLTYIPLLIFSASPQAATLTACSSLKARKVKWRGKMCLFVPLI